MARLPAPEAVVFDLDGTLVDTVAVRIEAWERLMLVFGSVLSGAVVVLTVARAMYHLFGRRNG